MNSLSPPNRSALSDTVIGAVMQRSMWKTRGKPTDPAANSANVARNYHQQPRRSLNRYAPYQKSFQDYPSMEPDDTPAEKPKNAVLSSTIVNLLGQTGLSTGRRRISCLSSDLKTVKTIMASMQGADHDITTELQQAIVAEALKKKIRHRERCRINQARYRQRQVQVETEIEDAIAKLRSEIKALETKCKNSIRLPTSPTSYALASEYFSQLNYYLSSPGTLHKTASKFLDEIMAPDVMGTSQFGVDAQLEDWRLLALYFDNVRVDLKGLTTPTSDTLVAGTVTSVTITSNTLRRAFPYLNSDGVGGTRGGVWSPVAANMLGKRFVMRGSVFIHWDNATDKMVSLQSRADMMTPMVNLLGSLEDVSCAFYKAKISPDCSFV